jgi:hypothetical protein
MFRRIPYRNGEEFQAAVEHLRAVLRARGCDAEAARLEAVLSGAWTTGSETIGEIMLALGDIRGRVPRDARRLCDDCHAYAKHHRRIDGLRWRHEAARGSHRPASQPHAIWIVLSVI